MAKSPDAFRTISEVAEWLGIQAHVLRFWESKFSQVKPVKRAGGRRYYRPNDMLLLGGIKKLLYEDGFTIKGVQKILREEGMNHVAQMSPPLDEYTLDETAPEASDAIESMRGETPASFDPTRDITPPAEHIEPTSEVTAPSLEQPEPVEENLAPAPEVSPETVAEHPAQLRVTEPELPFIVPTTASAEPTEPASETPHAEDLPAQQEAHAPVVETETEVPEPVVHIDEPTAPPVFVRATAEAPAPAAVPAAPEQPKDVQQAGPVAPPPAPKPRILALAPFTAEADFPTQPRALTALPKAPKLDTAAKASMRPLLSRLSALRNQMAAHDMPPPADPPKS